MKKVHNTISITTGILLLYVVMASVSDYFPLIFLLFLIGTLLLLYMVKVILKDAPPADRRFDDYYYDDADIRNQ